MKQDLLIFLILISKFANCGWFQFICENLQISTGFDFYVKTCSMGNDVTLMDKWYRKDTNKVRKEKEGNPRYGRRNIYLSMSLIFASMNTRKTYSLQCGIILA